MRKLFRFIIIIAIIAGLGWLVIPGKAKSKLNYPDGKTKYEGALKSNVPNGTGKAFDEEGKLLYNGSWKDSKKEGVGKEFFDDGKISYEGTWKNDLKEGIGKKYYNSSGIQYEGTFSGGIYSGKGKQYFESGKVKYDGSWLHGQKNGIGKEYFEDGKIKSEGTWTAGLFEKETPVSQPNNLNLGFINESGDCLYYSKLNGDKYQLIKVSNDDQKTVILNPDTYACFINVWKDWVYYSNGIGKVQKSKTDGTKTVSVGGTAGEEAQSILVKDDWIYFVAPDSGIYKMNIDGTSKTRIGTDKSFIPPMYKLLKSGWILIDDAWIYYINSADRYFYKMKLDGTERTKVFKERIEQANIVDGFVYYYSSTDFNIYKSKLGDTTTKPVKLTTGGVASMVVSGEWLYYIDLGANSKKNLMKIRIAKPEEKVLLADDVKGVFFNLLNEWVYYVSTKNPIYKVKADGTVGKEPL